MKSAIGAGRARVTNNFESYGIPSRIERTGRVRTVGRMDSGRRAYTQVVTACPAQTAPRYSALLATALVIAHCLTQIVGWMRGIKSLQYDVQPGNLIDLAV